MAIGTTRSLNTRLARLEAAAAGAGCALVCTYQSAEELHRALIGDYLRNHYLRYHAAKPARVVIAALVLAAALFILF